MVPLSICRKTPKQNPRGCATRILLITPPLLQPNTPYPATAVLAGHLQAHGFRAAQADLSLALLLRLFSADGLRQVEGVIRRASARRTPATRHFLRHAGTYAQTVDAVVSFLQGHDDTVAARILSGGWLVEGPRFRQMRSEWQNTGVIQSPSHRVASAPDRDLPKHLASLFLDDLADAIRDGVDPRFGFARYAEHLAVIASRFDPLLRALKDGRRWWTGCWLKLRMQLWQKTNPRWSVSRSRFPARSMARCALHAASASSGRVRALRSAAAM